MPRLRLASAGLLGRPGTPPAGHYDPAVRSVTARTWEAMPGTEARPPVKNRHGGAPRRRAFPIARERGAPSQGAPGMPVTACSGVSRAPPRRSRRSAPPRLGERKMEDAAPARGFQGAGGALSKVRAV